MRNNHNRSRSVQPSAFTLVEMLVSVTLVLLMMTLFASMFQLATGSMTKQRGISQLDQSARVLDTVVRRDLQKRTFRYVQPFYPNENSATSPTSFNNRAGYIYISTNDVGGLDDLIQFTVDANILNESSDATPFFGKATELFDRITPSNTLSPNGLRLSPNQPDADDGSLSPNSVATSPVAEVSYFIRNGNLYRRVNLIREPLKVAGQNLGAQPKSRGGYDFFSGLDSSSNYDGDFLTSSGTSDDFYTHFDHAAFYDPAFGGNQSASLLGVGSLGNESLGAASEVIANPRRRFGFDTTTGFSREHTAPFGLVISGVSIPSQFMGRFTHAETSAGNFNYPQGQSLIQNSTNAIGNGSGVPSQVGNPYRLANYLPMNPGNGVISNFDEDTAAEGRGGSRRVEDLLLANVHEMKIELWDSRLQKFSPPGHNSVSPTNGAGDYHQSRNINSIYGPRPGSGYAVFDTWHPTAGTGVGLSVANAFSAPYIPYQYYPPKVNAAPPGPLPATFPATVTTYWQPNTAYNVPPNVTLANATVVFGRKSLTYPGFDFDNNGAFDWVADEQGIPTQAYQIAYRAIGGVDAGGDGVYLSGNTLPNFPTAPGRRFTDGEIIWESFDNRVPLKSIRLSFRFLDKQTDNMRNLSLIIPMTEAIR